MIDDPMPVRQLMKQPHGLEVSRADVELQILGEVFPRHIRGPACRRGIAGDDLLNMLQAALFRLS
jgi:hypothetical protein